MSAAVCSCMHQVCSHVESFAVMCVVRSRVQCAQKCEGKCDRTQYFIAVHSSEQWQAAVCGVA
eukprot:3893765-Alexandrium_andersonii.AAC.1